MSHPFNPNFERVHFDYNRGDKTWPIESYESREGYVALRQILAEKKFDQNGLIEEVKASGLRGRGGAGFPTGVKWSFVPKNSGKPVYLCCNCDEGEPGTFRDRSFMEENPHQMIEGMIMASYAIGAKVSYAYIRGEYQLSVDRVRAAVKEAYAKGYLGKNILGSGFDHDMYVHVGAGAYICGDETALMNSIEGKKGQPRNKPPFPAQVGLFGCPTVINNTASLAAVPYIVRKGAAKYKSMGTEKSGGTYVFSISGHIAKPGLYEVPMGYPFKEFLNKEAGGMLPGMKLKALIPGGSSSSILTAAETEDLTLDYESMQAHKTMLGSGAMVVIAEGSCIVKASQVVTRFYHHESCGQCTPCREGTGWMEKIIDRIEGGEASLVDLENLYRVQGNIRGNTICPLGDAAADPVESMVRKFRSEFEEHIKLGRCPQEHKFPHPSLGDAKAFG